MHFLGENQLSAHCIEIELTENVLQTGAATMAVQHEGKLVTFDTGIPLTAVRKATTRNLLVL
jgi:hypothetical protein